MLNVNKLEKILEKTKAKQEWIPLLLSNEDINNNSLYFAHFLGQCFLESSYLNKLQENPPFFKKAPGKDGTPGWIRFKKIFTTPLKEKYNLPYDKITEEMVNPFLENPKAVYELVYGGIYQGRGLLQLTHKENYLQCSKDLGIPEIYDNPNCVAENKEYALKTAIWFFKSKKLFQMIRNKDTLKEDSAKMTKIINSGMLHPNERLINAENILKILDN